MRKFGTNKRNPNPPWPNEQPVVIIPPGSTPGAVGMSESTLRRMPNERVVANETVGQNSSDTFVEDERGMRRQQIMGEMPETRIAQQPEGNIFQQPERNVFQQPERSFLQQSERGTLQQTERRMNNQPVVSGVNCENTSVTGFLCGQTGKYVKLEFLFGENTHMEKIGILRNVGRDFVAIQENGTNNIIVCATNKIKFINIYEFGME